MNVLHITMSTTGGAGIACIRLHQGLLNSEISSNTLYLKDKAHIAETIPYLFPFKKGILPNLLVKAKLELYNRRLEKKLKDQPFGFEIFSAIDSPFDVTTHPLYKKADIVHLHWVCGFLDFSSFFKKIDKPVVWTLHDMFPFTGGCHHSDGCERFMNTCAHCPQLIGCKDSEWAAKQLIQKKEILKKHNQLTIIAPSQWLTNLSQKSILFKNYTHYTIPNGIDESIFNITSKLEARKKLDLPLNKKIILFVAQSVNNARKGIHLLVEALNYVKTEDILCVSIGKSDKVISTQFSYVQLGVIHSPIEIALSYQAADVFILPSLAENQPNTITESLLCGTPVIAFPVGGISEMIEDGINGLLCNAINAKELSKTIEQFFDRKESFNQFSIGQQASKKYSLVNQVLKYQQVYRKIMYSINDKLPMK